MQTRTFENRGLIYIGMELPQELKQHFDNLHSELTIRALLTDQSEVELTDLRKQNVNPAINKIMSEILAALNQSFADSYSYGDILTPENMDRKFTARFEVQQSRINRTFATQSSHNAQLLVTAAGDAFASPHFMRYSGLTGARENIINLQKYTQGVNRLMNKEDLLNTLEEMGQRNADFLIAGGRNFLKPL